MRCDTLLTSLEDIVEEEASTYLFSTTIITAPNDVKECDGEDRRHLKALVIAGLDTGAITSAIFKKQKAWGGDLSRFVNIVRSAHDTLREPLLEILSRRCATSKCAVQYSKLEMNRLSAYYGKVHRLIKVSNEY
jgi:hypothetical protein